MKDYKKKTNKEIIDSYDYLANAASTTDCTGLMPTPAYTEDERESYQEIYRFNQPVIPSKSPKK